jgi:RNA polymerase sigma-70 factor (ECF subfamily)
VSEADLVARSKRGDPEAFGRLIRRYEDRIYRLAHSVCAGLPAEAEDVYQETFLTAFKKISGFRSDADLGTWLYRIASNLCWMRFRDERRRKSVPLPEWTEGDETSSRAQLSDPSPRPDEAARKKELAKAVSEALGALPVEYRLALTLRDVEGLSGEDTAKALGLSLPAMKSRLHRGRLLLRELLDRRYGGGGDA